MHKSGSLQEQVASNSLGIRKADCRTPIGAMGMLRNTFRKPPIQWPIVTDVASYSLLTPESSHAEKWHLLE